MIFLLNSPEIRYKGGGMMKQFKTILKFEMNNYFQNKVFIGLTICLVLILSVIMFFPRFTSASGGETQNNDAASDGLPVMYIHFDGSENTAVESAFQTAFPDYRIETATDENSIKEQIASGNAECAFIIHSLTDYTYLVGNLTMYDTNTAAADTALQQVYRMDALSQHGITPNEAQEILSVTPQSNTESLGKDHSQNFFYTYIMIFALYMMIIMYGQLVATNVATEKSSRAMELLITSAKPTAMMFGKITAACLAGFTQLIAVFGSAYIFYNINKSYWAGNAIIASIFDMPLSLLLYMVIFFILGFMIYACLYSALGSMANKVEDINTLSMPLTLLFVAAFMVVIFSMSSGDVDNIALKICSFIPLTSPMAMFTRIAMSTVPAYEIIISVVILAASVIGIGVLSAKIYRVGVLLYGTTPKISTVIKALKRS